MQLNFDKRVKRRINLTPLIDVVFLLLIFFMLTSSFVHWRRIDLHVENKSAAAQPSEQADKAWISVTVNQCAALDSCVVSVNGERVTIEELENHVGLVSRRTKSKNVHLSLSDDVSLSCMVAVLDRVKSSGIRQTNISSLHR